MERQIEQEANVSGYFESMPSEGSSPITQFQAQGGLLTFTPTTTQWVTVSSSIEFVGEFELIMACAYGSGSWGTEVDMYVYDQGTGTGHTYSMSGLPSYFNMQESCPNSLTKFPLVIATLTAGFTAIEGHTYYIGIEVYFDAVVSEYGPYSAAVAIDFSNHYGNNYYVQVQSINLLY
jgi:hypothetical protein